MKDKYRHIDLDRIRRRMDEFERDHPDEKPFMKNHRWIGEDGTQYSSWDISSPGLTLHTGDGGAQMLIAAFEKEMKKMTNKLGKKKK